MIEWSLIDWKMVGFSALWILGLAIVLAALSMADYRAAVEGRRFRRVLGEPGPQSALNLGMTLFSAGLIYSGRAWWERVVWGLLALAFAIQTVQAVRRGARPPPPGMGLHAPSPQPASNAPPPESEQEQPA